MELERRGRVKQPGGQVNRRRDEVGNQARPYGISKMQVYEAYLAVKANKGAAGIDSVSLEQFGVNLKGNLYKIWVRHSAKFH